jgi:drug/metabolite transporter (DMT)-like permease
MICASIFSYFLSGFAAFYASSQIGSTKISFALQLETLFVVLFAIMFLKEKITKRHIFAGILIIGGGVLLQVHQTGITFTFADFIALLAPLFFSIGIILNTRLLQYHNATTITAIGQLTVAILLCMLIPWLNFPLTLTSLSLIILMSSLEGISWLCYNKGLKAAGASVTTILFGTLPFFTLIFSYISNQWYENFFIIPQNILFIIIGGILIFGGITIESFE